MSQGLAGLALIGNLPLESCGTGAKGSEHDLKCFVAKFIYAKAYSMGAFRGLQFRYVISMTPFAEIMETP